MHSHDSGLTLKIQPSPGGLVTAIEGAEKQTHAGDARDA
jgi:hypothetical protein